MYDTIAAIATPYGSGGIGIIRISGTKAFDIASKIFSKSKIKFQRPLNLKSHKVEHGYIFDTRKPQIIDEILLIFMKKPSSYTTEDIIEIQAHCSLLVLRTILDLIILHGARLAEPGEFTKRAFLNQRIDLTQAEAVIDILNAKSTSALKAASHQNLGVLKNQIEVLREKLIIFLTLLEANIDFADEIDPFDSDGFEPDKLEHKKEQNQKIKQIKDIRKECQKLIKDHDDKNFLRNGIKIAICGAPNVGKSSLMNKLLKKEKAIVTKIPGTTRDPIEECLNINGVPFIIVDTAGIHKTKDIVETLGIKKAKEIIQSSDIVLFMKEPGDTFNDKEFLQIVPSNKTIVVVINKIDLNKTIPCLPDKYKDLPIIKISALFNKGIDKLKKKIFDICVGHLFLEDTLIVVNLRHKKALEKAVKALFSLESGLKAQKDESLLSIDAKTCIDELGIIIGKTDSLDILDNIFKNFCVGK